MDEDIENIENLKNLKKPFDIGSVRIDSPVILGGLAGYSDVVFRLICRRFGAPLCVSEVMLDKCLLSGPKLQRRLAGITDDDHPVAGQLMGNDPEIMSQAAVVLSQIGFDIIDLNFACPVRKALTRRRGGAMMRQVELAGEIVRRVVTAVDRPVTIKIRKSFDQDDETNDAFWRIAASAFDDGAAAICLHARSVQARYSGPADWQFLSEVKRHFADKIIIGSGDVLEPADALEMLSQTKVDAVAVARGALGNPWFFAQVQSLAQGHEPHKPTLSEQRELIAEHFARACELYGEKRGSKIMRKVAIKYAAIHNQPKKARIAFVNVKNPRDFQDVLDKLYQGDHN